MDPERLRQSHPSYCHRHDWSGPLAPSGLRGARNRDWEDIALGPCGIPICLYLADTGDNRERQPLVTLYRVPEPALPAKHPRRQMDVGPTEAVSFRYPDGPHDVEAMWVMPNGDVHLVSKGRSGPIRHYRVPAGAWRPRGPTTAQLIESLPIAVRLHGNDRVTGAGLSPDGATVAIRTYSAVYFFFTADGRLRCRTSRWLATFAASASRVRASVGSIGGGSC